MKDWYTVYKEEIKLKKDLKGYVNYKIKNKNKLIKLIEKYIKDAIKTSTGISVKVIFDEHAAISANMKIKSIVRCL